MGLFGKKEEAAPAWLAQMEENRSRWFVFIDKLTERMNELGESSVPALEEAYAGDEDPYKRVHSRMLSGIRGQLSQMMDKARTVEEEKIHDFYERVSDDVEFGGKYYEMLFRFREDCREHMDQFEERYHQWIDRLGETGNEDLEQKYRDILDEYERIKDKFHCTQCGGSITIGKIFFISTYITCPYCQTQNTFEPSSQARMLEQLGRSLAEERCAHLLQAYQAEVEKERTIYHQMHELKLGSIDAGKSEQAKAAETLAGLEQQRKEAIAKAPGIYRQYLRAMFDEWNKIVPDLAEQNEKFYQRLLNEFNGTRKG